MLDPTAEQYARLLRHEANRFPHIIVKPSQYADVFRSWSEISRGRSWRSSHMTITGYPEPDALPRPRPAALSSVRYALLG
jgi:hypothetical protein